MNVPKSNPAAFLQNRRYVMRGDTNHGKIGYNRQRGNIRIGRKAPYFSCLRVNAIECSGEVALLEFLQKTHAPEAGLGSLHADDGNVPRIKKGIKVIGHWATEFLWSKKNRVKKSFGH